MMISRCKLVNDSQTLTPHGHRIHGPKAFRLFVLMQTLKSCFLSRCLSGLFVEWAIEYRRRLALIVEIKSWIPTFSRICSIISTGKLLIMVFWNLPTVLILTPTENLDIDGVSDTYKKLLDCVFIKKTVYFFILKFPANISECNSRTMR